MFTSKRTTLSNFSKYICAAILTYSLATLSQRRDQTNPNSPRNFDNIQVTEEVLSTRNTNLIYVEIFDEKSLKSKPYAIIDSDGLKVEDKLTCIWADPKFFQPINLYLPGDKTYKKFCKENFVINQYDDSGSFFGFTVKDKGNSEYYEIANFNKPLFIKKKNLKGFSFHISNIKLAEQEKKDNYENLQKLMSLDPIFKTFFDITSKCIEKRDYKCLEIPDGRWNMILANWGEYTCAYADEKIKEKTSEFCKKNYVFLCGIDGIDKETCKGRGLVHKEALNHDLKRYIGRPKNELLEIAFWNELQKCFEFKDYKAKFKIEVNELVANYDEKSDIKCEINKFKIPNSKKTKWLIKRIELNLHGWEGQPTSLNFYDNYEGKVVRTIQDTEE